jgi:hypothetical protein
MNKVIEVNRDCGFATIYDVLEEDGYENIEISDVIKVYNPHCVDFDENYVRDSEGNIFKVIGWEHFNSYVYNITIKSLDVTL